MNWLVVSFQRKLTTMELYTMQTENCTVIKHPQNDDEWIKIDSEHTIDLQDIAHSGQRS